MLQLSGVAFGLHKISARREGYTPVDSSVVVSDATRAIHFTLAHEPGGELMIKGDKSAEFYVDGKLVNQGVPNSGIVLVGSGPHEIKVVLESGQPISKTVVVKSRERMTFDFSDGTLTASAAGKTP